MPETDIGSAVASDLTNAITDFSVNSRETEAANGQKETRFRQTYWTKYYGYYRSIPELTIAIDTRATWTVGKGLVTDPDTDYVITSIKGNGAETFNTILENMIRTMWIGGDSYAEIIRDAEGNLINIKVLDPGVIEIVQNGKGIIKGYEQTSKIKGGGVKEFTPEEIFHLCRNRVADEGLGTSVVEKIENIILMRNESMSDYKEVMHRFMKPRYIFHLDTDDESEIAKFKATTDKAWSDGENMYIPKGAVVPEQMSISPNSTLNPQGWIESLNDYFYEAVGVPKVIIGNSKNFTEASSNTVYLAFQQSVEEDQLYIEEQVGMQLGMAIDLVFPASIENSVLSDKEKDGEAVNIKPSETTATEPQVAEKQAVTEEVTE